MTDFASCFSQYAVQVSDTSCRTSYTHNSCISPNFPKSIQNAVTSLYKTLLPTGKPFLIILTWTRTGFSVNFTDNDNADSSSVFKLNINSRFFKKQKGTKTVNFRALKIEVFWDFTTARYDTGPEPVTGFDLIIHVDSTIGLILGDKMKTAGRTGDFELISRREHYSGRAVYSTRTRFGESGGAHDICIRCNVEEEGVKDPVLSVCIDRKMVIRVKRLMWNFRGNRTVVIDGLVVDLMWDVHDWFHGPESGYGVFMFRKRSGLDSTKLWLEDEIGENKHGEKIEFSLMIYACKNL